MNKPDWKFETRCAIQCALENRWRSDGGAYYYSGLEWVEAGVDGWTVYRDAGRPHFDGVDWSDVFGPVECVSTKKHELTGTIGMIAVCKEAAYALVDAMENRRKPRRQKVKYNGQSGDSSALGGAP